MSEFLRQVYENPDVVRARARLFSTGSLTSFAVIVMAQFAGLAGALTLDALNPYMRGRAVESYLGYCQIVLGFSYVLVLLTAAYSAGHSLAEERDRKTLEFLRISGMSYGEMALGKLAGAMLRPLVMVATTVPFLVVAAGGCQLPAHLLIEHYLGLISGTVMFAAAGLLVGSFASRAEHGGAHAVLVGILTLGVPMACYTSFSSSGRIVPPVALLSPMSASLTIFEQGITRTGTADAMVSRLRIVPDLYVPLMWSQGRQIDIIPAVAVAGLQLVIAFWLLTAVMRRLRNPENSAFSRRSFFAAVVVTNLLILFSLRLTRDPYFEEVSLMHQLFSCLVFMLALVLFEPSHASIHAALWKSDRPAECPTTVLGTLRRFGILLQLFAVQLVSLAMISCLVRMIGREPDLVGECVSYGMTMLAVALYAQARLAFSTMPPLGVRMGFLLAGTTAFLSFLGANATVPSAVATFMLTLTPFPAFGIGSHVRNLVQDVRPATVVVQLSLLLLAGWRVAWWIGQKRDRVEQLRTDLTRGAGAR